MAKVSTYEMRLRALGVGVGVPKVASSSAVVRNDNNSAGLLVVGGSTALNRFGGSCSTPSTQHTRSALRVRSLRQSTSKRQYGNDGAAMKGPSVGAATGFRLLDLPLDACCKVFELLTPSDLGHFGSVASDLQMLPRDNWLWFNLTTRRFPTATADCNIISRLNWEDEYEYLQQMEARSRRFMVAQMQGRLGRLPPLPKRRNRTPVNYFQPRSNAGSGAPANGRVEPPTELEASGNSVLTGQAVGNRQGSGASVWSALKMYVPDETN